MFERITHKEEIEDLISDAERLQNASISSVNKSKEKAKESLIAFGNDKAKAWTGSMERFANSFSQIANLEIQKKDNSEIDFSQYKPALIENIRTASASSCEILKIGVTTVGIGATVGFAAYGGISLLGSAATGAGVKSAVVVGKSAAVTNWLSGSVAVGSKVVVSKATLVIGGVVVAPMIIAGTAIAVINGKKRLAEAQKIYDESRKNYEDAKIISSALDHIGRVAKDYSIFVKAFEKKYSAVVSKIEAIVDKHKVDKGQIDFDSLEEEEQKTLHLSWLLAQLYYKVLSYALVNEEGEVDKDAAACLQSTTEEAEEIIGERIINRKHRKYIEEDEDDEAVKTYKALSGLFSMIRILMSAFAAILAFTSDFSTLKKSLIIGVAVVGAVPITSFFKRMPSKYKFLIDILLLAFVIASVYLMMTNLK